MTLFLISIFPLFSGQVWKQKLKDRIILVLKVGDDILDNLTKAYCADLRREKKVEK